MFTRDQIADACRKWGPRLLVPAGIDPVRLLWAISGCESSFGLNCKPRHEPYYHGLAVSGKNLQLVQLTALYGCDAHSSFGPWQILLVNCSQGTKPEDFTDIDRCAQESVTLINARIIKHESAATVAEIADAYNSGDWHDAQSAAVQRYVTDCQHYYDNVEMPVPA